MKAAVDRKKQPKWVRARVKPRGGKNGSAWRELTLSFKDKAQYLPDDLSVNLDYYLHGARKQRPRVGRWLGRARPGKAFSVARWEKFNDGLDKIAAELTGLPPDLAKNHDHYLHGHPRA
jgi:hypothetical protein